MWKEASTKVERGCLQVLCKASKSVCELSRMPTRKGDGNLTKHREIHAASTVWSTAQR